MFPEEEKNEEKNKGNEGKKLGIRNNQVQCF